jgi:hypothetical protein
MNFQFDVSSTFASAANSPPPATTSEGETVNLLRQLLEVQREQLGYSRAAAAAHDMTARWRTYLARWHNEFPDLAEGCRRALPHLERCYGQLLSELITKLTDEDGGLDNDFALQEFLDRFGMRLAQLGTILNLVAPLAEAGPQQNESAS